MLQRRFDRIRQVLDRRQPDLTVLMDQVNKSHNFSAILRNCDAVGVLEAHAVPPDEGLPLHHGTSAGTARWIPVHEHPTGPAAIEYLRREGFRVVAAHPDGRAVDYRRVDYTRPTAILMGAELYGVSEEARALADTTIRIPMAGMVRSLNVSVAASLLLYEAYRQREEAGLYATPRLDPDLRSRLLFEWAHPKVARRLRERDRPYPELAADGSIVGHVRG